MKTIGDSFVDMETIILNQNKEIEELKFKLELAEKQNKCLAEQNRSWQQAYRELGKIHNDLKEMYCLG